MLQSWELATPDSSTLSDRCSVGQNTISITVPLAVHRHAASNAFIRTSLGNDASVATKPATAFRLIHRQTKALLAAAQHSTDRLIKFVGLMSDACTGHNTHHPGCRSKQPPPAERKPRPKIRADAAVTTTCCPHAADRLSDTVALTTLGSAISGFRPLT